MIDFTFGGQEDNQNMVSQKQKIFLNPKELLNLWTCLLVIIVSFQTNVWGLIHGSSFYHSSGYQSASCSVVSDRVFLSLEKNCCIAQAIGIRYHLMFIRQLPQQMVNNIAFL